MSSALDMQRERARALASMIVRIAPAGSIACIFAGGSLGRGEVWAADVDGVTEIYSDLDLYIVAQNDAARELVRSKVIENFELPEERSLRLPDIGFYTPEDLAAQPLRPGTVELDAHHLMLYGDERLPLGLNDRSAARIAPEEALYLLENRVWDVRQPIVFPAHTNRARLELVIALKAQLDVYSAHAIVAGTFSGTLEERSQRFRTRPPATLEGEAHRRVVSAFDAARDIGTWLRGRDAESERVHTLAALAEAWLRLAPIVLRTAASPSGLVARRCRAGALMANARDVLRLRRRFSRSWARIVPALPALALRSPVDALRVYALAEHLALQPESERAFVRHIAYVDALTRCFGFADKSLAHRAGTMYGYLS